LVSVVVVAPSPGADSITAAYCDRILVMDAGLVAEFDSPLDLFDREGSIFRSLCDEAGLSRADILRMRAGVGENAPRA
jgi:ATP-binding cassette subfamily C (CFTR/MRP) protein 1